MKSLKESIFSDVEDIASNDTVLIEQFLKDNYNIRGTYNIDDNVVDVDGHATVKNKYIKSLTNGVFRFRNVTGKFSCAHCKKLASLEGAPEMVDWDFDCSYVSDGILHLRRVPHTQSRCMSHATSERSAPVARFSAFPYTNASSGLPNHSRDDLDHISPQRRCCAFGE